MIQPRLPHASPLAILLMTLAFSPAFAADPAPATAAAGASAAPAAPVGRAPETVVPGAMMMARDPLTGELRAPTAEEMAALGAGLSRAGQSLNYSDEGLKQVVLPDGTVMVDLQGRFMSTSVAFIDADGRLVRQCNDHPGLAFDHRDHAPTSPEVRDER